MQSKHSALLVMHIGKTQQTCILSYMQDISSSRVDNRSQQHATVASMAQSCTLVNQMCIMSNGVCNFVGVFLLGRTNIADILIAHVPLYRLI